VIRNVRGDFPILTRKARNGRPLVYLDSAATAHKPTAVLEAEDEFYRLHNGAVGRGAHLLAEEATEAFEGARADIARFVGARIENETSREIIWAENATAGINLVASGIANASQGVGGEGGARFAVGPGDEIVVTESEHHANLIPWQVVARRTGATLKWIGIDDDGRLSLDDLDTVVTDRTRVLAFQHASNVTGIIHPVERFVARAREVGALTVLDACQSVPNLSVDFPSLGVDFAAFSGHKMLGPTGVGALYGREDLLDALPPSVFGGSTVKTVTMTETTWLNAPQRFEAGSQPVAQAIGMAAAARYLAELGMENVEAHEHALGERLRAGVAAIDGVRLLGPAPSAPDFVLGLAAFVVEGVHPHDVGQVLDAAGIAVRVGHHCAQPLHGRLGVQSSTRASTSVYTTQEEIDAFLESLAGVRAFFGVGGAL
jgi:cysteine desulfurase / selenocysteine lyase